MNQDIDRQNNSQLLACVLTPGGRGAVATIGLRGDLACLDSHFQAASRKHLQGLPVNRVCFGHWGSAPGEEIVLVKTGDDTAELHCHGGTAAVARIVQDLAGSGGKVSEVNDWLMPGSSRESVECQQALMQATTQRAAHHLLRQCTLFPAEYARLAALPAVERRERIEALLAWSDFGLHLTTPWKVVLCGRPNVGKSSLLNALVGYTRSVVFDQPGTTRDVVAVETAFNGWPVELSDTAGIRETAGELESAGIALARKQLDAANVIIIVLDAAAGLQDDDRKLLQALPDAIVVWNKTDLAVPHLEECDLQNTIQVSATTGAGIASLMDAVVKRIVPREPSEEFAFPVTHEQCTRLRALSPPSAEKNCGNSLQYWK